MSTISLYAIKTIDNLLFDPMLINMEKTNNLQIMRLYYARINVSIKFIISAVIYS